MANEVARTLRKRMTRHEVRLWLHLRASRPQGLHFRRQAPIGNYVVDYACLKAKLIVGLDGSQHGMPGGQTRDRLRDEELAAHGYRVLRVWNADVDRSILDVVETIIAAACEINGDRGPPPSSA